MTSSHEEEEPFEYFKELEAKSIGNLLTFIITFFFPEVIIELRCDVYINNLDDLEDFDLFRNGWGMELEGDEG